MIHTKQLTFHYNGIDFEASVRYNDAPFGDRRYSKEPIFFNVQLLKPISMDCEGEFVKAGSMSAMMLLSTSIRNYHYVYDNKSKSKNSDNEINIYPKAVKKILYHYFNREKIDYYNEKISRFCRAIDVKYEANLEALREERRVIRQKLKSNYRKRYFSCCELKKRYRVDIEKFTKHCNTPLGYCDTGSDKK